MKKPVEASCKSRIYTMDAETDPFYRKLTRDAKGNVVNDEPRIPQPFAWCIYDGNNYVTTWGDDCTERIVKLLYKMPPAIVYIHNGGKFDTHYLLKHLARGKEILVIDGRITQCYMECLKGYHRIRDSYKLIPEALDKYQKTKIDYAKFERNVRDANRDEILAYLKDDCRYLMDLVEGFISEFGLHMTIGGAAEKELRKFHDIGRRMNYTEDTYIRKHYFHGGRVQAFARGRLSGGYKIYDVNSMYPYVMSEHAHPVGTFSIGNTITDNTAFLMVTGVSNGAFPYRDSKGGLVFPADNEERTYSVTIHEYRKACELGLFKLSCINETVDYECWTKFDRYVQHYYAKRQQAKASNDTLRSLFYKLLLNNSYGRMAINPMKFEQCIMTDDYEGTPMPDGEGWSFDNCILIPDFDRILWKRSAEYKGRKLDTLFQNVGIAASVTGAARATLLNGIANSKGLAYCDTDSVICRELLLDNGNISDTKLGSWKLEKVGKELVILGPKMYALFNEDRTKFSTVNGTKVTTNPVKLASKGVRMSLEDMLQVASGETVTYYRDAPTFRLNGGVDWVTRRITIT